jgi:hypothetical protein
MGMHGIASLVWTIHPVPNGRAARHPTMLSAAPPDNLSVVMPLPIPWYGFSRRLDEPGLKVRKIEKFAIIAVQRRPESRHMPDHRKSARDHSLISRSALEQLEWTLS